MDDVEALFSITARTGRERQHFPTSGRISELVDRPVIMAQVLKFENTVGHEAFRDAVSWF